MDIKKISEIIALAVPPLILCSCIRLVTYYSHWDIPILDYVNSTELLFSFVKPGLVFMALGAIYFATLLVFTGIGMLLIKLKVVGTRMKTGEKVAGSKAERKRGAKGAKVYALIVVIGSFGLGFFVIFRSIWYEYDVIATVIIHILLWGTAIMVIHRASESKEKGATLRSVFIATIITLMSASFFYGRFEAWEAKVNPSQYRISLRDSSVLETSNRLLYLGKTAEYYFLFNVVENRAMIVPAGEVKSIGIILTPLKLSKLESESDAKEILCEGLKLE